MPETFNAERDAAIRRLAGELSQVAAGQPIDVSIAGAALFIVCAAEAAENPELLVYAAKKLRQVADVLQPPPSA